MAKNRNRDRNRDRDVHHVVGKMNHTRAKVELDTNKVLVKVLQHQALNTLCNDKQCPQEQLEVLYYNWWKPVLSERVCREIEELLSLKREDFYIDEILK